MIKVLLVDDDYIVLKGIAETFDFEKLGMELVGCAESGEEALEKYSRLSPDIIITDICMHTLNGIEFLEKVRTDNKECVFVIMSGYDNFEYVKSAIELEVCDYILKPIEEEKLQIALLRAKEKFERSIAFRQRDVYGEKLDYLKNDFLIKLFSNLVSKKEIDTNFEVYEISFPDDTEYFVLYTTLKDCFVNYKPLFNDKESIICHMDALTFAYIVFNDDDKYRTLRQLSLENPDYVIGVSGCSKNKESISTLFEEAKIAYNSSVLSEKSISFYSDTNSGANLHIVTKAMSIIQERYATALTINDIANELFISKSYLMSLFKKKTGISINSYIASYRMQIAKELLSTNKYKIYEVAYMVGYNDVKSFRKVFKKHNGLSPTEYFKI